MWTIMRHHEGQINPVGEYPDFPSALQRAREELRVLKSLPAEDEHEPIRVTIHDGKPREGNEIDVSLLG